MKAVFALFLLIPPLSGCLDDRPGEPGESDKGVIEWGLGLDTRGGPLVPRSFAEPPGEIRKLRDFLANTTADFLSICGVHDRSYIDSYLHNEYYLDALQGLPPACNDGQSVKARQMAQEMIANDSVDADLEQLRARAEQAVVESRSLLEALPQRGSIADLEVVSVLFSEQRFIEDALEASKLYLQSYNESPELINLQAAVLNVINPERTATISISWIVENYPWKLGTCKADMVAVEGRLRELIEAMEKLPRPDRGIESQGRAWDDFWKDRERYYTFLENHRFALELSSIAVLSWRVALVQVESPLPTHVEAQYLFDAYRNETRTLLTDRFLESYLLAGLEDYRGSLWTQYGIGTAARAKSVFAMDWPIEAIQCS